MRDVMLAQDCLYPLVERSLEGDQARGQKIVGLHLFTKARALASFRNFVPKLLPRVIIGEITEILWNTTMVRQSPNAPARAAAMSSLD